MSAYLSIFELSAHAMAVLVSVVVLSSVVSKSTVAARSVLLSTGMWLAPIFYSLYVVTYEVTFEIVLAFLFEILVLIIWIKIFSNLYFLVNDRSGYQVIGFVRLLKYGIAIQIAIGVFLFAQAGIGLFSAGSRIEYLEESRINLYFTYASILVAGVSVPIAAAIVSYKKKWDNWVIVYIALVMALSILSGSKGGAILLLIGLISYIRLPSFIYYLKLLRFPLIIGVVFIFGTIYFVSNFLQIEPGEMVSLMFSRLFLVNDGRALAIDFAQQLNQANVSLFQESFRAIASAIGSPPINIPLGQLLYQQAFSTETFTGANTSSTALLIAYGGGVEKVLFFIILASMAICIYVVANSRGKNKVLRLSIAVVLLNLLSQDFLAFQVTINLLIAIVAFLFVLKAFNKLFKSDKSKLLIGVDP